VICPFLPSTVSGEEQQRWCFSILNSCLKSPSLLYCWCKYTYVAMALAASDPNFKLSDTKIRKLVYSHKDPMYNQSGSDIEEHLAEYF
jgi:hypothetical protein